MGGDKLFFDAKKINKIMIDSILLVDDESLFHLVFEDACSLLDISLTLEGVDSSDHAANLFQDLLSFPLIYEVF